MPHFRVTIRAKLALLMVLSIAGLAAVITVAATTVRAVRVGGPAYDRIVLGKDLIADILPPPEYIIESYLIVLQLQQERDPAAVRALVEKSARLRKDYDARHEFWEGALEPGAMKTALLETSAEPAHEFFRVRDERFIPAVERGDHAAAAELVTGPIKAAYEEHRAAIDEVVEMATAFCADNERQAAASLSRRSAAMYGLAIGSAVVVGLANLVIGLGIIRPIRAISARMADIAEGEGDLTKELDLRSDDELGRLARSFNGFLANLRALIGSAKGCATQVAAASTQIAASSEEMAASMDQIAQRADQAAGEADRSGARATEGGAAVAETVADMHAIRESVLAGAASVAQLGARGDEIGRLVAVITDIADQTNLLALNAAIEAARAGEHGRGFAVVADEVRKLADRTAKATGEIAGSIAAIQSETKQAVERMNAGSETVTRGADRAAKAGEGLSAIVDAAGQAAQSIGAIATATAETREAVGQAAQATAQLSSKAEELQALVGRFKV